MNRLQFTGRFTTGEHKLANFCSALFARQLFVSSYATSDFPVGMHSSASPSKKLYPKLKLASLGNLQIAAGTMPVKLLCDNSNSSTILNPPKLFDISTPVREFRLASTTVELPNISISGGKHPTRSLLRRTSSFSVAPIFPMLLGMHPPSLLLASTTTEALDSPKFSGM